MKQPRTNTGRDAVAQLLEESGQPRNGELADTLLALHTLGSTPVEPPRAELAALMASRAASLRWASRRRRTAFIGGALAVSMGAGVTGVAAVNPTMSADRVLGAVMEKLAPPPGPGLPTRALPANALPADFPPMDFLGAASQDAVISGVPGVAAAEREWPVNGAANAAGHVDRSGRAILPDERKRNSGQAPGSTGIAAALERTGTAMDAAPAQASEHKRPGADGPRGTGRPAHARNGPGGQAGSSAAKPGAGASRK
jgi:hypothetical protein